MQGYKLEKDITLYKSQFETYMLDIFKDYRMDRLSIEIDAIMFRIKYMTKHQLDLDLIPGLKEEFTAKALQLRNTFGIFMKNFLVDIIGLKEYPSDVIEDVLAQDVKIDTTYVKFKMILISKSEEYLKYVDETIPDNEVYNMFPDKYFRFYTDSYNDGIAKAFPELFENKHQDVVGVGDDGDVFVHNFTFQTSEACSLNCSYCFAAGTRILMEDGTYKNIEDIEVGDMVIGFDENPPKFKSRSVHPTKVTKLFAHFDSCYVIKHPALEKDVYVTGNHPVLIRNGTWKEVKDLEPNDGIVWVDYDKKGHGFLFGSDVELDKNTKRIVYNFETESHTYVAERLAVHNCYQMNKTPMRMDFSIAKEFIDNLLEDKYGYINRYNSPAIIIEFIGGEPLLEIDLTRKIYEYFLQRCYELNHPWFTMHRLSICSNGLQYFDQEVQDFFQEYYSQISFNISIDGNKELHDSCRKQHNGEGSYDIDMAALNHFNKHYTPERNSKMTLAPQNIGYLFDSVVDFINHGMTVINLNCVFEEGWEPKHALILYEQLKKLADYILANGLEHLFIAMFRERQEGPMNYLSDSNSCGGAGAMLALRPNGQFYPCLRYMPSSVGNNVKDLCIGTVQDGMIGRAENSEILHMMDRITRRTQSNDICFECPIGNGCSWCSALAHTVYGTPNKRPTFICIMEQAQALANVYYWNALNIQHPEYSLGVRKNMVPDEWALLVIDEEELNFLKLLEVYSMIITIEKESE